MKKPTTPSKPTRPTEPKPPEKIVYHDHTTSICCGYDQRSVSLKDSIDQLKKDVESNKFTITDASKIKIEDIEIDLDVDSYDPSGWVTVSLKTKIAYPNDRLEKQQKIYERRLKKYKEKEAAYNGHMEKYNLEMEKYKEELEKYEKEYTEKEIKRLQRKLKKLA